MVLPNIWHLVLKRYLGNRLGSDCPGIVRVRLPHLVYACIYYRGIYFGRVNLAYYNQVKPLQTPPHCCKCMHKQVVLNMTHSNKDLTNYVSFHHPSIAQLVERRTVVGLIEAILRSLVRLRLEGIFSLKFIHIEGVA